MARSVDFMQNDIEPFDLARGHELAGDLIKLGIARRKLMRSAGVALA
jgi:hypothetical protein